MKLFGLIEGPGSQIKQLPRKHDNILALNQKN